MDDPLESAGLRLERAAQVRRELEQLAAEHLDRHPAEPVREVEERGDVIVLRDVLVGVVQPPTSWAPIVGDYVTGLRAVLDHLVWELSVRHSGPDFSRPQEVSFPIHKERQGGRAPFAARQLRWVSPEARTLIEEVQPFHARGAAESTPLYLLQQLSNAKKHRSLQVVALSPTGARVAISPATIRHAIREYHVVQSDDPSRLVVREVHVASEDYTSALKVEGRTTLSLVLTCPNVSKRMLYPRILERLYEGVELQYMRLSKLLGGTD